MANFPFMNEEFETYYLRFSKRHDLLREELMDRLGEIEGHRKMQLVSYRASREVVSTGGAGQQRLLWRAVASVAAVLVLVVGVMGLLNQGSLNTSSQAWASAIEYTSQVDSIHFRLHTPSGGNDMQVEMWWKKPHLFRMCFSGGTVITGNQENRCTYRESSQTVLVQESTGPGPEMFILGELGELFTSEYARGQDWIEQSRLQECKEIIYKGEKCLKIHSKKDGLRYEYIVDRKEPLVYEVECYNSDGRLVSRLEVLDVNQPMDDSMFEIDLKGKTLRKAGKSL